MKAKENKLFRAWTEVLRALAETRWENRENPEVLKEIDKVERRLIGIERFVGEIGGFHIIRSN